MKLAFIIERRNYYRLLGPIIERALARGWPTECWHDWGQPRRGPKASEFPDSLPVFMGGLPTVRTYLGTPGLSALLAASPPHVVIALRRPAGVTDVAGVRWFGLQYTLDLADLLSADGSAVFDAVGLHSAYWREHAADCLRIRIAHGGGTPAVADRTVAETLERQATVVGIPEMDQCHWIDPTAVRERLGLDPEQPVVLYIPFPFRSNPRTFWVRHIYGRSSPLWQRVAVRLAGQERYRTHIDRGWTDANVVRAVRAFCDRNGAALVVKARVKDPVPRYLKRCADRVLSDEHYYPATILELLKISTLCLHSFSTVAYEAASAGVPSICVAADADDLGFPAMWRKWFLNVDKGSSFNFPGVVHAMTLAEIVDGFGRRGFADFPLDAAARARYVEKFIGFDDGKCSERVLDSVQALVDGGRR